MPVERAARAMSAGMESLPHLVSASPCELIGEMRFAARVPVPSISPGSRTEIASCSSPAASAVKSR
jgi:hypothetical protein